MKMSFGQVGCCSQTVALRCIFVPLSRSGTAAVYAPGRYGALGFPTILTFEWRFPAAISMLRSRHGGGLATSSTPFSFSWDPPATASNKLTYPVSPVTDSSFHSCVVPASVWGSAENAIAPRFNTGITALISRCKFYELVIAYAWYWLKTAACLRNFGSVY